MLQLQPRVHDPSGLETGSIRSPLLLGLEKYSRFLAGEREAYLALLYSVGKWYAVVALRSAAKDPCKLLAGGLVGWVGGAHRILVLMLRL